MRENLPYEESGIILKQRRVESKNTLLLSLPGTNP